MMKTFITKFMNSQPQKQCTSMEDVHMEMDHAINLATWISQGEKCTKLNTSNMCNLQFQDL
jgi:hypothetical protein